MSISTRDIEARRQSQQSISGADQLRTKLDALEVLVATVSRLTSAEALRIPVLFDDIYGRVANLKAQGTNIQAEAARLRATSALFQKNAAKFLRVVDGDAFRSARAAAVPEADQWWWFVDRYVAEQRQRRTRRLLIGTAIGAAIVLVLTLLYNAFLAPPPEVQERVRRENNAQQYIASGDFASALNEVELALTAMPDFSDLLVLQGVIQEEMDRVSEAEDTYTYARRIVDDESRFLVMRAQNYSQIGQFELALDDLNQAIEDAPELAEAYYIRGAVNQALGDYSAAYLDYDMAASKAEVTGNTQLQALARVQLGYLSQQMMTQSQPPIGEASTATP